jgi:hypothetical protein
MGRKGGRNQQRRRIISRSHLEVFWVDQASEKRDSQLNSIRSKSVALLHDSELKVIQDEGKVPDSRVRNRIREPARDLDRIHIAPRETSSWSTTLDDFASSVTSAASLLEAQHPKEEVGGGGVT